MDTIADADGVSKSTLYERYPTKQALLRAVIAVHVASWAQDWEGKGGPVPTDLRQRLKHRARSFMEYFCSGRLEILERLDALVGFIDDVVERAAGVDLQVLP